MSRITLVVATDRDGLIGARGGLPWRLPADLRRFREQTMGKPVVMGRRTHESIGRALPGRRNLVVTRNRAYEAPGCEVVASLEEALERCAADPEVMIVGGAEIYAQALPRADRILLTRIDHVYAGDARFPDLDDAHWREVGSVEVRDDPEFDHPYRFVDLERRRGR